MGLTCSLLGHAFEDAAVEREREEQGSEVVTAIREVEVCGRCGERRVVSENKEVTTVVEPEDVGIDEEDAAGSAALGSMADAAEGDGEDDEDDDTDPAVDADEAGEAVEPDEAGEAVEPESEPVSGDDAPETSDDGFEPPADPSEEDAEILGEETPSERRPGQWPDDEGGFEPEALTGGAPSVEADTGVDVVTDAEGDATTDAGDEPTDAERPEPAATSVPTGDYVCPECGFSTPAAESSLREGDSCPECRRGYLTGR